MSRPDIGTLRGAATLDDESYLDFVEGLRGFNLGTMVPKLVQSGNAIGAAMGKAEPPASVQALFHRLGDVPVAQMTRRMMRSTQLMMWSGSFRSYGRFGDELAGWLDEAEQAAPGLLTIDPAATGTLRIANAAGVPTLPAGTVLPGVLTNLGGVSRFGATDADGLVMRLRGALGRVAVNRGSQHEIGV